jgi:hypothetical protein
MYFKDIPACLGVCILQRINNRQERQLGNLAYIHIWHWSIILGPWLDINACRSAGTSSSFRPTSSGHWSTWSYGHVAVVLGGTSIGRRPRPPLRHLWEGGVQCVVYSVVCSVVVL